MGRKKKLGRPAGSKNVVAIEPIARAASVVAARYRRAKQEPIGDAMTTIMSALHPLSAATRAKLLRAVNLFIVE